MKRSEVVFTLVAQDEHVDAHGWFDLGAATGRSLYRLPVKAREADEGLTHCSSLVALFGGDVAVDPRSGGVIGFPVIAEALGRSERQTRRLLRSSEACCVRWCGDLPATAQNSAAALRELFDAKAREAHARARRGKTKSG